MNHSTQKAARFARWTSLVPLVLLAVGATAQTVSAEELRAALKDELAPPSLSIEEQAKAVVTEMAANVVEELATAMAVSATKPQLAARDGRRSEDDNS